MNTEMLIESWPIDRPIEYARNARRITQPAVDKVAASIQEFGFRQPIVVDTEGVIIVGHVRLRAAKKLGLTQVPVHVAASLTPAQAKAYRLMDNRSHEEVEWDLELLGAELLELKDLDVSLVLTGFDTNELDKLLLDPEMDQKANEAPLLPEVAVTLPGDLWRCGPHRLLCGDSTRAADVSLLLTQPSRLSSPQLMIADPPYGVSYCPEWRVAVDGGGRHATGKVANDDRFDWSAAWRLFSGDVAYVWHAGIYAGEVSASLLASDFQIRGQIIWRKQHFVMSRGAYHWQHEPCWYAVRKGKSANWCGDRAQTTVWDVANLNPHGGNKEEEQTGHGTQKPVELMRRPILNHTRSGDAVYDPFLGSGTTLIAAEMTQRVCYGLELDPKYCDVIVERWQNLTGKQAMLDSHGATFEHVGLGRRMGAEDAIKENCLELLAPKQ